MAPAILLVDAQRDVLRLLHSALDTLGDPDLEILEASSSEAALHTITERSVDVLVTDYGLAGPNGLELMRSLHSSRPELGVILITNSTDRQLRDQLLDSGAVAVFSKPVPLGDFLAAVERGLGKAGSLLPVEASAESLPVPNSTATLLSDFRRETGCDAVFLISHRGRIEERTGDLRDSSMEVSLISALSASFSAGLKVAELNSQGLPLQFEIYAGGGQDLVMMPVDAQHALVVAGQGLGQPPALPGLVQALTVLKDDVARALRRADAGRAAPPKGEGRAARSKSPRDLEAALDSASADEMTSEDLDAFWDAAASQHANKPMSEDVIPYEQARKMGLTPDSEEG